MSKNNTLLITGGTGSFGNAVLRRFLNDDFFKEIRILSRDEKKQDDMRQHYKNDKIKYYIGDTRNKSAVTAAMRGADFVFQAAALKQVPSCEFFPAIDYPDKYPCTAKNPYGDKQPILLVQQEHL
jgi:UDP-N-acetylglucosamine 4,6-dehydratase